MSDYIIPFNKPYITGREIEYINEALRTGKISGDGIFTKKCQKYFEDTYGFNKVFLTTSCTDALEMASILTDIKEGDEVILPSYTFPSTATAFALRGANLIFADCRADMPNIDEDKIEMLITSKTKAIVVVHYAGIAVNMEKILEISRKYNLFVIEDAAQAIESYYISSSGRKQPLGSIGHLAAFSFHETKNIISGEGGMLVINDEGFIKRAEIIREKGTNRSAFFRGELNKYGWVDIGSSFLPSEIIAAFLFAQLENVEKIQNRRREIWQLYYEQLKVLEYKGLLRLPMVPDYATNNAHMFYIICRSIKERDSLIYHLKKQSILAVFHYQSLHKSIYYRNKHDGRDLKYSDNYSDCLLRLPFYFEIKDHEINMICDLIKNFFDHP